MRTYFGLFLLFLLPLTGFGQERDVIGISPFSYASYIEAKYVGEITEAVSNEFVKAKRFTIVDRTKLAAVTSERELQKSEEFIDSRVIAQGKSIGARYIVTGHLASIGTSNYFSAELKRYIYSAKIAFSLKIIDVETGEVVHAETFGKGTAAGSTGGGFFSATRCDQPGSGSSTEQAIRDAIANIGCAVDRWIKVAFPVMVSIVEVQEMHKRKGAQTVLLAAGKMYGLSRYKKLKVIELVKVTVDGKELTRQKEVGILSVQKVEDDNFSICDVIDGGETIAEKLGQKTPLKVVIQ
ncbi:CsgG/HfaB family protein [Tellurirhabdus rosea]|uniref:CsgG/HfaB family protein n=1 Tax=Tellurirhabdus rosea TaxID=2674997 RepID=UPI0022510812|nr:CsgG/HfaB family protein [Tellurirhabdus rosea]